MVHMVNYLPNRRGADQCEYREDPVPLHDVRIALRVDDPIRRPYIAADRSEPGSHAVERG